MLEEQNKELTKQVELVRGQTALRYEKALAATFTPGQIRKLVTDSDNKKIHWKPEDIAAAISLRSVSPKAYRYLRLNNYPLPALSTLRNWVSTFNINQGILKNVITLMKKKSSDLCEFDRICVLSFDEIYISNKIEIDKKQQLVIGPHKSCQTVMVRGLFSNWKQPIFYKFDQTMTREILESIIQELFNANYLVIAISSDMGAGNVSLWSKLNVGHNKNCYFNHPSNNSLKIFVFADIPHLIKLARNHILDQGFVINNSIINIDYFQVLLNISVSELTLAHKLTDLHLNVKGSMRQRVRPAVQLFSNTVAKAISYAGETGLMPQNSNWELASYCVQLFNDWFDLFNSKSRFVGNCPTRNAFGTDFENQKKKLNDMSEFISCLRVGKHKELIPFQKGILLSNKSLIEMFQYLTEKYKIEYIMTYRLNQDVLENFFAYIRGMGGPNDHPSPMDFKYRLRWYILGKHSSAIFTENRHTMEANDTCLLNILNESDGPSTSLPSSSITVEEEEICLTQKMLANFAHKETDTEQYEEEALLSKYFVDPDYLDEETIDEETYKLLEQYENKTKISNESLKYIAGFVAYKFKNKYDLGIPTKELDHSNVPDWLEQVSRGSLLYPSNELWRVALTLESEFHEMHGSTLSKEKNIFTTLAEKTKNKLRDTTVPFEVISYFCRTRTYIRLRDLNRKISFQNCKRKLDKKMSKLTNFKK